MFIHSGVIVEVNCQRVPMRNRLSGVVENLWLNLPFWQGSFGNTDVDAGFPAVHSISNYENLCTLLFMQGLADSIALEQQGVHKEFRQQPTRNREKAWYATELP